MNGAQDLGGMMGFGPVQPEPNEPWFHAAWEREAFAITIAMGASGTWNLDMMRHARESLPPAVYLGSSYYEIWTRALQAMLLRHGLVSEREVAAGHALEPPMPVKRVVEAADVERVLAQGGPTDRPVAAPARFRIGEQVRTRVMNPTGHTRLPRYARGKRGVVERAHGGFVFPDTNAHGLGEAPQWLYTVAFPARELWGEEADPTLSISIDAWESYLDPIPEGSDERL